MEIKEKFVETKFGRICYLEAGEGEKTIMFIHGWLGWPTLISETAESFKGYKIIAPYLPGHGKSCLLPDKFDFKQLVGVLTETMNKLSSGKVVLIGHSLGGSAVWEMAVNNPKKISHVILLDAGLRFLTEKSKLDRIIGWVKTLYVDRKGYFRTEKFRYLPNLLHPMRLWKMSSIAKISEDRFPQEIPVLALWGKTDYMTPIEKYESILKKLKNLKITMFNGSHYWFIWQEQEYFAAIKDFLSR